MPDTDPPRDAAARRSPVPALAAIALVVTAIALAFAWTAGLLSPGKLTPDRMTDAIERSNGQVYPGYRRAHAKGICISGYFQGNGNGVALSKAPMFTTGPTPFVGRMSIGGGKPHGDDGSARVRSMALGLVSGDGQEWRMAMNSFPFFAVSSVEAFHEQVIASTPMPDTGKPDPERMKAFLARHPEAARFAEWARTAPWPTSFANTTYNGVNTFRFTNPDGVERHVRWSMQPQTPLVAMTAEQREVASQDFLSKDLIDRLAQGPLLWDMLVTLAGPGDSITDPAQAWPADRQQVNVGTVVIESAQPQATGPCRDLNFDPLLLPAGVDGSEDPILAARSAVYSPSFNRRQREIAHGRADDATSAAPAASQGSTP
jgi:catalase